MNETKMRLFDLWARNSDPKSAEPFDGAMRVVLDAIESRLLALEGNLKWLYEESGLDYPANPEPDKQPYAQPREWIPLNLTTEVWARKNDGGITRISFGAAINRNHLYTHIMPYRKGDKQPEPPKGA
jgi:hypothetical protein